MGTFFFFRTFLFLVGNRENRANDLARSSRFAAPVWAGLLVAVMISSVTSAPAEDLIARLPGQPSVAFEQYGGYVTVDESHGRALFYYFVEAESKPESQPLTLWLNGGPGCSSLGGGGFTELGPFYPNATGKSLIRNDNAWNQVSNIIFLESPAGVGFSYSNTSSDYATDDVKTGKDALKFLLGWLKKFPEYGGRDFYIAGESYAGHYAPQLAIEIVEHNKVAGALQIPLKALLIGNPLFDYTIDTLYSPNVFLWAHGLISDPTYNTIITNCNLDNSSADLDLTYNCTAALGKGQHESGYFSGYVDPYDVLGDVCSPSSFEEVRRLKIMITKSAQAGSTQSVEANPCIDDDEETYLNLPEVQKALHARPAGWEMCSESINYNESNLLIPILPVLRSLLDSGLRLWVFSGDQDSVIPFIGTRQLMDKLGNEFTDSKINPTYRAWFQGQQIGGWTRDWGSLTFATVKGAGHLVPRTQGPRALQLFTSFITSHPLPAAPLV